MSSNLPTAADISNWAIQAVGTNFKEVIAKNIGSAGISVFDLDTAKVPAGGMTVWALQTLEGSQTAQSLEGVIVYKRPDFTYYSAPFGKAEAGAPPDCISRDGIYGVGNPGGVCRNCPMYQFGSGQNGKGKACRERMLIFLLRKEELLPMLVVAPTMSVKPVRQYFMRLASRNAIYHSVITRLALEKARSSDGIDYAKINPMMVAKLEPEQAAVMAEYAAMIAPLLESVQVDYSEDDVETTIV